MGFMDFIKSFGKGALKVGSIGMQGMQALNGMSGAGRAGTAAAGTMDPTAFAAMTANMQPEVAATVQSQIAASLGKDGAKWSALVTAARQGNLAQLGVNANSAFTPPVKLDATLTAGAAVTADNKVAIDSAVNNVDDTDADSVNKNVAAKAMTADVKDTTAALNRLNQDLNSPLAVPAGADGASTYKATVAYTQHLDVSLKSYQDAANYAIGNAARTVGPGDEATSLVADGHHINDLANQARVKIDARQMPTAEIAEMQSTLAHAQTTALKAASAATVTPLTGDAAAGIKAQDAAIGASLTGLNASVANLNAADMSLGGKGNNVVSNLTPAQRQANQVQGANETITSFQSIAAEMDPKDPYAKLLTSEANNLTNMLPGGSNAAANLGSETQASIARAVNALNARGNVIVGAPAAVTVAQATRSAHQYNTKF